MSGIGVSNLGLYLGISGRGNEHIPLLVFESNHTYPFRIQVFLWIFCLQMWLIGSFCVVEVTVKSVLFLEAS